MKRTISLILVAVLMFVGTVFADTPEVVGNTTLNISTLLQKMPDFKQGVMYSVLDKKFNYISTFKVVEWKSVSFEAGFQYDNSLIGVVSYPFFKMKDFGVTIPVLDLVECNLGIGVGSKRLNIEKDISGSGNNEFDVGITATLINVKF